VPTFFSLTPSQAAEYRHGLFNQIHEIVFFGKGGYDWHTVYEMPIWLRNFTMKKIQEHYEEKNKAQKGTSTNDMNRAKSILQQAERSDPGNAQRAKYTDRVKTPPSSNKVTIPDFVTSKSNPAKK
jgi:hypothetical protein